MGDRIDRRKQNNPHPTVRNAGAAAARRGDPIHSCPYSHPAMRNSWLAGFAGSQQIPLGFAVEHCDA